ncbi:hypothetical protein ACHAWF_002918 [Thalassiosira exigua]
MAAVGVLVWYFVFAKKDDPDPIAACGGCHCIAAEGGACPAVAPRTNFTQLEIDVWAGQVVANPDKLACNPYEDGDCGLEPTQDEALLSSGGEAVCAVHINEEFESDDECKAASYKLATYASSAEAEVAGGFVTHVGHCGVCSTVRDLAAYLNSEDLTSQGKFCAKQGALSLEAGLECYRSLGMTDDCATIWAYNSRNTARECFAKCFVGETLKDVPNNRPAPECRLNDCLQCDEDSSGAIFQKYAGRTRRNSGLLSAIARPCDALVPIEHDPCPQTTPLSD